MANIRLILSDSKKNFKDKRDEKTAICDQQIRQLLNYYLLQISIVVDVEG